MMTLPQCKGTACCRPSGPGVDRAWSAPKRLKRLGEPCAQRPSSLPCFMRRAARRVGKPALFQWTVPATPPPKGTQGAYERSFPLATTPSKTNMFVLTHFAA